MCLPGIEIWASNDDAGVTICTSVPFSPLLVTCSAWNGAGAVKSETDRSETVLRSKAAQLVVISVYNDRALRVHIVDHLGLSLEDPRPWSRGFRCAPRRYL